MSTFITNHTHHYHQDTLIKLTKGKDSLIHITRTITVNQPIPYIVYIDSTKHNSTLCDSIREYSLVINNDTLSIHNDVKIRGELISSIFKYDLRYVTRVDTLERTIFKSKKNNIYLFGSYPIGLGLIYTRDRLLCGYNYQINQSKNPSHNILIGYKLFSK